MRQAFGMGDRKGERVDRAQRHADQDEFVEAELVDKALGVGELGPNRIISVMCPVAVAMAALVERDAMILLAQREADEVPGVRGQGAAMQEQDRRQLLVAPIEIVRSEERRGWEECKAPW